MNEEHCPLCGARLEEEHIITARLRIVRCTRCAHRVAEHSALAASSDYHKQYSSGAFLESLQQTRKRQASVILSLIRQSRGGDATDILDYGCGRAWFLDHCREVGVPRLAGCDTSPLAVDLLSERGIEALLIEAGAPAEELARRMSFLPSVITFLDVLEHVPAVAGVDLLRGIVAAFRPELRLVVIKVPSSRGLLYRMANLMTRAGRPALLEQLYQAGTEPPHVQYFSPKSLELFLDRAALRPVAFANDADFEPESLRDRVAALSRVPQSVTAILGRVLRAGIALRGSEDSLIVAAEPP